MPVFEEFPYTNFHELNLDWLIKQMVKLKSDMADFVGGHTITYADPILWSILTYYPAYTIVLDSYGNAYMAVQDTPAGTPLTDTEHWMQIGNFYGYMVTYVNDYVDNALQGIEPQHRLMNKTVYYIDGTDGSDDNDGLSSSTAFKTLDKFLSLSQEYNALEGHIITAGTYTASGFDTLTSVDLRIFGDVSGIIVNLPGELEGGDPKLNILNSHFRLENCELDIINGAHVDGNIVAVNSVINLTDVDFTNGSMECYGGEFNCTRTKLQWMDCHNADVSIHHAYIQNTDPDHYAYQFLNCMVRFRSSSTTEDLTADATDHAVIVARGSHVTVEDTIISATAHKYFMGIDALYSTLIIVGTVYNHLGDNTQYAVNDFFLSYNVFKEGGVNP